MPTLLIGGVRDPVIPFRHTEVAHAAMPGSQLSVFPRAGHFPHPTSPVGIAQDKLARAYKPSGT